MSWLAISNPRTLWRAGFLAALYGAGLDGDLQRIVARARAASWSGRAPNGIRTRAAALKGRCPRPLDDGGAVGFGRLGRHQPAVGTAPAYGKTPRTSKADRPRPSRPGFRAIPLAKIGRIRHGKRYRSYTVMTTADDLGGRHWTTRGHVHA